LLLICLKPLVQVKSIESDPMRSDLYLCQVWPYLGIEAVFVHTQVMGRVP